MKKKLPSLFLAIAFTCGLIVHAQTISTVAGNGTPGYSGDGGPATSAQFNNPISVALDAAGNMYVADFYNHRIRKINTATNIITTIAGTGTAGFSGDGGLAINAQMNNPGDLCADAANNIYFIDNQNFRVRKIDAVTGTISTVAGNGTASYAGETILAINAGIHYPNGLAVDAANLYISLFSKQRICKVNLATGMLSTIGGTGINGYSGDGGPAVNANFGYPAGLSVSASGEVYVADYNNSRIRKIDAAGIVTTVAGNGSATFSGDGVLATNAAVNFPTGVFIDAMANIFIADRDNNRVRKVNAVTGIINTVAGNGVFGYGGDGSPAISPCTKLAGPHKVRLDAAGNIFISDQSNSRIRKVDTASVSAAVPTITISAPATTVCAGSPVTFTSVITNGGANPFYQWQVNGNNAGTNSPVFTSATLSNTDVIRCVLTSSASCVTPASVTSNTIVISFSANVTPTVSITASATSICSGSPVNFTAVTTNSGNNPSYQWKINNSNAGTNNPVFITSLLQNNDVVSCSIIADPTITCVTSSSAGSNQLVITVAASPAPVVTINASDNFICANTPVVFTAIPQNAGNAPSYAWKLNGNNTGTNNAVYTNSNLFNGDQVTCMLTANNTACPSSPVSSNIITMLVKNLPVISISPANASVPAGSQVQLTATVNTPVNLFQWSPPGLLVNPFSINPLTKPLDSNTTFFLSVTDTAGCTNNKMVEIKVYNILQMPAAFTPDNNGLNDIFRIPPGVPLILSDFSVYDRWGNRVFTTTDITKGWDGNFSGKPFNTGVFVYIISGVLQGKKVFLTDSFTLIR